MMKPRNRTARGVALSGAALAFGLFAAANPATAGGPSSPSAVPDTASEAMDCDMAWERCDVNREARELGFGRRGGDK